MLSSSSKTVEEKFNTIFNFAEQDSIANLTKEVSKFKG